MKLSSWSWVVVGLVAAAGCGGSGGTAATASAPPATGGATVEVGANGAMAFTPQTVTINPGDTITWEWFGGPHTVTSGAPGAVDGLFCSLPNGVASDATSCNSTSYAQSTGSYAHKFDSAGSYKYFCTVHGAMMTGIVNVGTTSGGAGGGGSAGGSGNAGGSGSGGGY